MYNAVHFIATKPSKQWIRTFPWLAKFYIFPYPQG